MIAAMCANPCVDRTVSIEKFTYGGMNRIRSSQDDGSGKGVNIALACAQLGMDSVCLGFMPGERNSLVLGRLAQGGCNSDFVPCNGAVRVNTKVLDQSTGVITELNESGPAVTGLEIEQLIRSAVQWAGRCGFLVLTGSTPPGCPADLYKTIIEVVRQQAPSCRIVLDAEGTRFAEGLKAVPYMVKPNRYELELLCGHKLETIDSIHTESQNLIAQGIGIVAVSMGGEGAYITDGKQAYWAPAMKVPVRSTVGAGDSMVAGMLLALEQGLPLGQVFRHGVAAASSSVTTVGTGLIDAPSFRQFLPLVDVRQVL